MSANLPAAKHVNLAHQYGCAATMTVVTFLYAGIVHRARRFWREDMPTSGKVEIYTIEPYPGEQYSSVTELGWYTYASEDFLRYARRDVPGVEVLARALVTSTLEEFAAALDGIGEEQSARFAMLELN